MSELKNFGNPSLMSVLGAATEVTVNFGNKSLSDVPFDQMLREVQQELADDDADSVYINLRTLQRIVYLIGEKVKEHMEISGSIGPRK